jgi:alpha-beta hydrolase superfamily lysophospholipase
MAAQLPAVSDTPATASAQSTADSNSTEETKVPPLTASEQDVVEQLKSRQYLAVRNKLKEDLRRPRSASEKTELLNLLAYTDLRLNQYKDAMGCLHDVLGSEVTPETRAITLNRLGDLYLRMRKNSAAIDTLKSAFSAAPVGSTNLRIAILDPIVGCLIADQQYAQAQPFAEQFVTLCKERAKSDDLENVGSLFWAELRLSQIYKQLNQTELRAKIVKEILPLIDGLLKLREQRAGTTLAEQQASFDQFEREMRHSFIEENHPDSLADYLWLGAQFRMRTLPLIEWTSKGADPSAVILCVHGLGLENRAFGPFAEEMTAKHFTVYAMDVRGFGAWQTEYGTDTVNFTSTLEDVASVIRLIKIRHPGLPVFLVGESMGGAIALRAASEFGSDMTGAVASVPSADRFKSGKQSIMVAMHIIRPNQPFDIGAEVAAQATSSKDLRELWMSDPKAKMDLSPVELIKFDAFMKTTKKRCANITTTPTMVVQGMADKLAKPKGTYEMFDKVENLDKTMIILGGAEHLIFETPTQNQILLDGLATWFHKHSQPAAKAR